MIFLWDMSGVGDEPACQADAPGHARATHIRLIFVLDMRGVGQPERLRAV
jgi:hypothetical protein